MESNALALGFGVQRFSFGLQTDFKPVSETLIRIKKINS
jgi:hypothetical protein